MSWSVNLIGTPARLKLALQTKLDAMTDQQSKEEFSAALPGINQLLDQNFDNPGSPDVSPTSPVLRLTASGSGTVKDGKPFRRNCHLSIASDPAQVA